MGKIKDTNLPLGEVKIPNRAKRRRITRELSCVVCHAKVDHNQAVELEGVLAHNFCAKNYNDWITQQNKFATARRLRDQGIELVPSMLTLPGE